MDLLDSKQGQLIKHDGRRLECVMSRPCSVVRLLQPLLLRPLLRPLCDYWDPSLATASLASIWRNPCKFFRPTNYLRFSLMFLGFPLIYLWPHLRPMKVMKRPGRLSGNRGDCCANVGDLYLGRYPYFILFSLLCTRKWSQWSQALCEAGLMEDRHILISEILVVLRYIHCTSEILCMLCSNKSWSWSTFIGQYPIMIKECS